MKNFPKAIYNISNNDVFYSSMSNYDSTSFFDISTCNHTINNDSNILQVSGYGALFDSSQKYLDILSPNRINIWDKDFTIEIECYFNSNVRLCLLDIYELTSNNLSIRINESGNGLFCIFNNTRYDILTSFSTGKWYHFCWVRKFNMLLGFINGVKLLEISIPSTYTINSGKVRIGSTISNISLGDSNFYMKNLRISYGSRYNDSFSPNNNQIYLSSKVNINSGYSTHNYEYSEKINLLTLKDIKYSSYIKTINHQSVQLDFQTILLLNSISDQIFSNSFTLEFYIYISDINKNYVLASPQGLLNSWSLEILNKKLVFNDNNLNKIYSTSDVRTGWNHVAVSRNTSTLRIYLNISKEIEITNSEIFKISYNSLVFGKIIGYSRDLCYKIFKKQFNCSTIHSFNLSQNWLNCIIYFKLGYVNDLNLSGDVIFLANIYKTSLNNIYINYKNLLISQYSTITIDPTKKYKEIILFTTVSEYDTDLTSDIFTITLTRLSNHSLDTYPADLKISSIKAVLMPDVKIKTSDPVILYNNTEVNDIYSNYTSELSDTGKLGNPIYTNLEITLPEPTENFIQLNYNSPQCKTTVIYSSTGRFISYASQNNLIQFLSYNNSWHVIVNSGWKFISN